MAQATYRAAVLHDALDLRIEALPVQEAPPGHVVIRPLFCGICGSDLHFFFDPPFAASLKVPHSITGQKLPTPFGHEFAGRVVELGPECSGLDIGDLVAIMPVISDKTCYSCLQGSNNACSQLGFIGINGVAGGLSDRAVVPADLAFKLPAGITPDIGALIEPLSVAWHAIGLLEKPLKPDSPVLVIGAGPVGCAVLVCLLAQGATNVIVSEVSEPRRKFASTLGAKAVHDPLDSQDQTLKNSADQGYEAIFDCAGAKNTLVTAAQYARSLGTIVNVAIRSDDTGLPFSTLILKEITFKSSISFVAKDFLAVIDAIDSGRLNPQAMITKRIGLNDLVKEGFEALHSKTNQNCKILVDLSL